MGKESPGGRFWIALSAYAAAPPAFWGAAIQLALRHFFNPAFTCFYFLAMCVMPVLCVLAGVTLKRYAGLPGAVGLASLAGAGGVFASWFAGGEIRGHEIVVVFFSLPTLIALFVLFVVFGNMWLKPKTPQTQSIVPGAAVRLPPTVPEGRKGP